MKDEAIYFNDMDIHIELKPIDSSIDFYWQQDGEEVELKSITSYSDNTTLELKKAN